MGEFISFERQKNEPKKSRPYRIGLQLLCALQLRTALRNSPMKGERLISIQEKIKKRHHP
jgi:hypothetical protein